MFERDKSVKKLIDNYGMVIVDECHHVSATNFNKILSETRAKYVYGLTATPIRKDGHHPIIFMQCGPIRYKVDAKKEAKKRTFENYIIPRFTSFRKPVYQDENDWHISDVYKHICESKLRNALIIKDVEESIEAGRNPLLLTERASHIEILKQLMSCKNYEVIELSGRLSTKKRKESLTKIKNLKDTLTNKYHSGVRVVICTKKTEEYSGTNKKYVDAFISECTNEGLDVIQINKNKHKFMVIDDEIIWYGGIDILGVNRGEESERINGVV
jgi:superfamily II DNA or RNA helicase